MSKMDKDIFFYLVADNDNVLLQKYRDYFPLCNHIPVACDSYIFMVVYILYIPIVCCIILLKHFKNIYYDMRLYIKHPLLLSKGMAYNAVLPYIARGSQLTSKTFNKIYWGRLFRQLGIDTPSIKGTIKDGVIKYQKGVTIDKNSKYIIKEVYGCCGNGVVMFDKNNIPSTGYYIIQDYIELEDTHKTYRIITNSNNITSKLMEVYSLSNSILVTNISHGGQITMITNNTNSILRNAIRQSIKAHNRVNSIHKCNTIGWDIIIKDDHAYFLEGNIGVCVNKDTYIKHVDYFYKNNV